MYLDIVSQLVQLAVVASPFALLALVSAIGGESNE
jgi:hypothetical protein